MNARNSRNGIILFAVYLLFYGGFVFVNSFDPTSKEKTPIAGLNVALLYGSDHWSRRAFGLLRNPLRRHVSVFENDR